MILGAALWLLVAPVEPPPPSAPALQLGLRTQLFSGTYWRDWHDDGAFNAAVWSLGLFGGGTGPFGLPGVPASGF